MATQFQPRTLTFESPGTQSFEYDFKNTVRSGGAYLQGYSVSFGDKDHHLRDLEVNITNVQARGTLVGGDVTFNMKDGDNNPGRATITIGIAADVES